MGWERKRGMLNQFNEYLLENIENPFRINTIENYKNSGDSNEIPNISYIITLDADTDLSLNSGIELVGAMAHILNKPILNENEDLVISGNALMQPRVGVGLLETRASKFAQIYAGEGGTDSYTNAISDTYQDNFGEGIFTGKGIYDLKVFSTVLNNEIKENAVLSHDLLEGSYLRCGLVSDIMLMDGTPTNYMSFRQRLYRWIRGDFQLIPWLGGKIENKNGDTKKNPLNKLSKYKILSNIIRSKQEFFNAFLIMLWAVIVSIYKVNLWYIPIIATISAITPFLLDLINKDHVDMIAIGNGTASRESEMFVSDMIKEVKHDICYVIVSEAGASVYSASKLATEEYPDINVSIRGAISIARRLQDPLAELVKIDPKAIGVGQYQHDVNQKKLSESLTGVVEDSVNKVGVDVNTATPSLLSYVSGINNTIAKNIVKYRDENGKLKERKELLKVPKLGKVAYEQCAGFIRIPDGKNPLENTAVHPESYEQTEKLLELLGFKIEDLKNKENLNSLREKLKSVNIEETAKTLDIGEMTLADIISELSKPGRDPREDMPKPVLRSDVLKFEDLTEGMVLTGTVRNVIDFGAFVDIGVKYDGLVHISEMSDSYVKSPSEIVSVGDIVKVKVIKIDQERKKVGLSMKIS